jgi:regulator of replication initiation timing
MMIPKSVKFQSNLTECEIKAYYSLKPLDEDYNDHDKRFSKILNDYLETKNFKTTNARNCYKKQLKKMVKDGKKDTPKFKEFNMWRLKEIEKHISRQKDYILQREDKAMPPSPKINELVNENNNLKLEIEKLKKQLQEKDEQIDYLMVENTKMKHMPQEVEEKPKPIEIHEIKECLIIETSEEEEEEEYEGDSEDEEEIYVDVIEVVEDLVDNVISLRESLDDSDEEEESEEESEEEIEIFEKEDEVRPIEGVERQATKEEAIELFQKDCIKMIDQYHEEFMKLKQSNDNIHKITNDILDKYDEEVIQPNVEKLDDVYDLPHEEYTQVQEKPYEKMKDKILYFSD